MVSSDPFSLLDSIILGIVQGLTEFFPVSSDGHLALAQAFLNYHKESLLFDVMLHLGTLGAIYIVFRKDAHQLVKDTWRMVEQVPQKGLKPFFSDAPSNKWISFIWITTFITGVLGLILEPTIEALKTNIQVAGAGFLVTSAALFLAIYTKHGRKNATDLSWWFPVLIGAAQAAAIFTGVSRSGMTICTALLLGLRREEAGRYSFVAAMPIIAMAVLYEARKLGGESLDQIGVMSVGVIVSFLVGLAAIKGLLAMLKSLNLMPFAVYTFLLGLACLIYGGA